MLQDMNLRPWTGAAKVFGHEYPQSEAFSHHAIRVVKLKFFIQVWLDLGPRVDPERALSFCLGRSLCLPAKIINRES